MAISAAVLLESSGIAWGDLPFDSLEATVDAIDLRILPIASDEANGAVDTELKGASYVDLDSLFAAWASKNHPTEDAQAVAVSTLRAQYAVKLEGAIVAYGRSEIRRWVRSIAPAYGEDGNDNRIQGNQRTAKLIEWIQSLINDVAVSEPYVAPAWQPQSHTRRMRPIFW